METSVALIIAKTVSPSLRFIRFTEPVVIIDVTLPAAVRLNCALEAVSHACAHIIYSVLDHAAVRGEHLAIDPRAIGAGKANETDATTFRPRH